MLSRKTVVLALAGAAGCWLLIAGTLVRSWFGRDAAKEARLQEPVVEAQGPGGDAGLLAVETTPHIERHPRRPTYPPSEAQPRDAPVPSVERPIPPEPQPAPDEASPEFPVGSAMHAQAQIADATRTLAVHKVQRRVAEGEPDEARREAQLARWTAGLSQRGLGVEPDVRCAEGVCEVSLPTADAETLARIDELKVALGERPMTVYEGQPSDGIVTGVTYYLFEDGVLEQMVGDDSSGIFAPGPSDDSDTSPPAQGPDF